MKKTILALLFVFLLIVGGDLFPSAPGKPLTEKYRQWLDLVTHIITKDEKTTFLLLDNDRDREIFVSLFWNLRDPSPGTGKNEFREEHLRRFQYANKYFRYGTSRRGRQTDMGQVYIILGEPESRARYDVDNLVVPTQVWSYYGKKRPGLPSAFRVVFWKKDNIGEYRLYDPASDGPHSLLRPTKETTALNPVDVRANYEMILQHHPELAAASLTLIPDDMPYDFNPSLRSQLLLQKVMESPREQINDTYAVNFLKYKGKVEVDYSANYIESRGKALLLKDPETGLTFVHFALRPESISTESSAGSGTYSFHFDLIVSLNKKDVGNGLARSSDSQREGKTVFEYRKRFPFTGNKEEMVKNFRNSLIVSDYFPVVEGEYRLSALLRNRVNNEFTYFETPVSVKPGPGSSPAVSGLLISREVKPSGRRVYFPFRYGGMEVAPDPRNVFGTKDRVFAVFNLERGTYTGAVKGVVEVRDLFDDGKYEKSYPFESARGETRRFFSRELEPMKPGYYKVTVRLTTPAGKGPDEKMPDEKVEKFTVTVSDKVADTTNISRTTSFANRFLYYHIVGLQYMRLNRLADAEMFLEKAFNMQPNYPLFVKDFCTLLLMRKKPDRVLEIAENLKDMERERFHYHALRGKAFFQKAQYREAVKSLAEANRIYDSDISVLNVLGFCYLETGNKKEAKKVLAASLRLDDRQGNIARALKELE